VISGGGNWAAGGMKYQRVTFQPTADEYSHFTITSSYIDLVKQKNVFLPNVSVHVASQQQMSFIKRYYDEDNSKIYPFLTAIIDVKDGVVIGVSWDDACLFCGFSECEENTYDFYGNQVNQTTIPYTKGCYVTKEDCEAYFEKNIDSVYENKCALNIYFVWTGTDVDGNPLRSYNSRFSAFPPNIVPKIADAVVDATSNAIAVATNATNDAIDTAVGTVTNATNNAIDTVVDTTNNAVGTVTNATNNAIDTVTNATNNAIDTVTSAKETVVDTASKIAETAGNATESVTSTVSSIADEARRLFLG